MDYCSNLVIWHIFSREARFSLVRGHTLSRLNVTVSVSVSVSLFVSLYVSVSVSLSLSLSMFSLISLSLRLQDCHTRNR